MSDSPDKQDVGDVVKLEGGVESKGADERGTASVDAPVLRRRRLQYSLRSLFFLALVAAGLFWTLRVLAQSGRDEGLSELYIHVAFAAAVVLLLNLKSILSEVRRIRTAVPSRVTEDEVEVEQSLEPGYQSPWDR